MEEISRSAEHLHSCLLQTIIICHDVVPKVIITIHVCVLANKYLYQSSLVPKDPSKNR